MAALVTGSTVRAARGENTAATPAGTAAGTITTGHHIILFPKLAPSWDRYTSAAVIAAPAAVSAAMPRSNRPVRTSFTARPASARTVRRRSSPRFISVSFRAGQEFLRLLFHALLEHAPRVLVAVDHRARQ